MKKLEHLQVRALRKNLAVVIRAGSPVLVRRRCYNVALLIPLEAHYEFSERSKAAESKRIRGMARRGEFDLS